MSHLLDQNDQLLANPSRELTLSTGSILAIFVGLALLCGLFYGFGYNMGHRSALGAQLAAPSEAADAVTRTDASDTFSGFKPASGSAGALTAKPPAYESAEAGPATPTAGSSPASASHPAIVVRQTPVPSPEAVPLHKPVAPTPVSASTTATSTAAAVPAGAGVFVVQVAAVSHQEDADLLLGALRARGYAVASHSETSDKLIHIQVGPFPSKPAAEAMRQRLMTDGYNAIIK